MNIHEQDIYFKAKNEGAEQAKLETARNMLCKKIDFDTICECTDLPLETIEQLSKEVK